MPAETWGAMSSAARRHSAAICFTCAAIKESRRRRTFITWRPLSSEVGRESGTVRQHEQSCRSVIQGFNQYRIYYANGLQSAEADNVYEESGTALWQLPCEWREQSIVAGRTHYRRTSVYADRTCAGGRNCAGISAAGSCVTAERNYYVVIHDTNLGHESDAVLRIRVPASTGTSFPLAWPIRISREREPDVRRSGHGWNICGGCALRHRKLCN